MKTSGLFGRSAHAAMATLALGASFATGCTSVQTEFCDAVCECQNCGEKGQERCDVGVQAQLDIADTYGCLTQAEAFYDCAIDNAQCVGDEEFEVNLASCEDERDDYDDCTADSSRRDPGAY